MCAVPADFILIPISYKILMSNPFLCIYWHALFNAWSCIFDDVLLFNVLSFYMFDGVPYLLSDLTCFRGHVYIRSSDRELKLHHHWCKLWPRRGMARVITHLRKKKNLNQNQNSEMKATFSNLNRSKSKYSA